MVLREYSFFSKVFLKSVTLLLSGDISFRNCRIDLLVLLGGPYFWNFMVLTCIIIYEDKSAKKTKQKRVKMLVPFSSGSDDGFLSHDKSDLMYKELYYYYYYYYYYYIAFKTFSLIRECTLGITYESISSCNSLLDFLVGRLKKQSPYIKYKVQSSIVCSIQFIMSVILFAYVCLFDGMLAVPSWKVK